MGRSICHSSDLLTYVILHCLILSDLPLIQLDPLPATLSGDLSALSYVRQDVKSTVSDFYLMNVINTP